MHTVLMGKPEGKRQFGRPKRRWEGNIKIDVSEIWREREDWIHLAQNRTDGGPL